ncbi:hypothetical protein CHS0354_039278 [Potamilus streckersoni]|uniref:Uncharacterized protein n=1 Tax=Potamilus streckersoni TaxID=2493646 RepID=A0AAE0VF88_9BIVA|nr:hypothetical protein CHS0354_039278 [Potamilus streckersoni]
MERGRPKNLEALTEEDDEGEEAEEEQKKEQQTEDTSDESSSESDDEPDAGVKKGEPNKFDILCDGVVNSIALVHTALEELLEMKDELLRHSLPPTMLIKLATISGKLFRSVSDLNNPVNEMVRLVRVYSTPWEEKSAALKKLHEEYETKQRQLNIAIKRLQLVDAHSKRIAKEKRVMNWEKLFAKMMSNKGHGRRWKFLIETIKQKAKLGLEHVQEYTRALDESTDDEEEDEMPTIQLKSQSGASPDDSSEKQSLSSKEGRKQDEEVEGKVGDGEKEEEDEKSGSPAEEEEEEETKNLSLHLNEEESEQEETDDVQSQSLKKVRFAGEKQIVVKPPMSDATVWTQEPDYDNFLFVRVYCPQQMEQQDLKCSIAFGKSFFKTKRLDDPLKETLVEGKGSSASKGKLEKDIPKLDLNKERFEEVHFELPDDVPEGVLILDRAEKKKREDLPKTFQISVQTGLKDEMVAMATIKMEDLYKEDLKTIYLPEPHGDDNVPKIPGDIETDSMSDDDIEIILSDEGDAKAFAVPDDLLREVKPLSFPLYSIHSGAGSVHKPCGILPLVFFYGKRARPRSYNRQVGTYGVTELVFDLTGINLNVTTKEALHKEKYDRASSSIRFTPEMREVALSAIGFSPEPSRLTSTPEELLSPEKPKTPICSPSPVKKEEMIPKLEYEKIVEKHSQELHMIQAEYEKRLQQLQENLQAMEQMNIEQQHRIQSQVEQFAKSRPKSTDGRRSKSPHGQTVTLILQDKPLQKPKPPQSFEGETPPVPKVHAPVPPPKPKKSHTMPPRVNQPAKDSSGVPVDFLERLAYFEELSYRHKQDLNDQTIKEIQEELEKKLASQHKLSQKEREMYEALRDVSLPALFMPLKTGNVFNPRAHLYFHPTGSSDMRLTQPPSVFQLPPLPRNRASVVNLFELSRNFHSRGPGWLMDRYIQQQEPLHNVHIPQTPAHTSNFRSPPFTPLPTQITRFEPTEDGHSLLTREREAEV